MVFETGSYGWAWWRMPLVSAFRRKKKEEEEEGRNKQTGRQTDRQTGSYYAALVSLKLTMFCIGFELTQRDLPAPDS